MAGRWRSSGPLDDAGPKADKVDTTEQPGPQSCGAVSGARTDPTIPAKVPPGRARSPLAAAAGSRRTATRARREWLTQPIDGDARTAATCAPPAEVMTTLCNRSELGLQTDAQHVSARLRQLSVSSRPVRFMYHLILTVHACSGPERKRPSNPEWRLILPARCRRSAKLSTHQDAPPSLGG